MTLCSRRAEFPATAVFIFPLARSSNRSQRSAHHLLVYMNKMKTICPQGGGGPTGSGSSVVTIGGLSVPPAPHLVPATSSTTSCPPPATSSHLTNSGSPSTSTPPPPPPSSPHASRTPPVPPRGHHHISTTYITQVPSILLFTEFYKLSSRTRALLQSPPQVPEERTRPAAR